MNISKVRSIIVDNIMWYCALDLCKKIGIKNCENVYARLDNNLKQQLLTIDKSNRKQNCTFITIDGVKQILLTSRKPNSIIICNELGINTNYKSITKETEFVHNISKVFINENIKLQFKVEQYKLDMYFLDYKLAIEFDEKYHASQSQVELDVMRQKIIENELKCSFIRVPEKSNIFEIIGQIYTYIKTYSPQC